MKDDYIDITIFYSLGVRIKEIIDWLVLMGFLASFNVSLRESSLDQGNVGAQVVIVKVLGEYD